MLYSSVVPKRCLAPLADYSKLIPGFDWLSGSTSNSGLESEARESCENDGLREPCVLGSGPTRPHARNITSKSRHIVIIGLKLTDDLQRGTSY